MPNERKEKIVADLTAKLEKAESGVLVDFSGLDMPTQDEMRAKLREHNIDYKVIKNTLLLIAFNNCGLNFVPDDYLVGQNGLIIGYDDAISAPKSVKELMDANDKIKIKGGFLRDRILSEAEIKQLATIPGKDQLRAQLVGSLAGSLVGLVNVLQGNIRGLVNVLNAHKDNQ